MTKIQVFNQIDQKGLDLLTEQGFSLVDEQECSPDAILLRSHKLEFSSIADSVNAVVRAGAGTNNVPVAELTQRGVPVFNTPGANANAVIELVLASMLMCQRNLIAGFEFAAQAQRDNLSSAEVEKAKKQFVGSELSGKTLGVIGLGSIGVLLANAAIGLGMNVVGYDPHISVKNSWQLSSSVMHADSLAQCCRQADFISIHVPLLESTKHLIDAEVLRFCQSHCVLLNFARAELVDDDALEQALKNKAIAQYACDFPSSRWKDFSQVITFPHLGASTLEATSNCANMAAKQLINFIKTGSVVNAVNFPVMVLEPVAVSRIAISNENIPGMVSQISDLLAEKEYNITQLNNKSRDNLAYTVVDIDRAVSESVVSALLDIEGVLRIRIIEAA